MREMAAELAPLDPGRSALAYLYCVDRQTYTELQNEFARDVPTKALEIVRDRPVEDLKTTDPDAYQLLAGQYSSQTSAKALEAIQKSRPDSLVIITSIFRASAFLYPSCDNCTDNVKA